MDGIKLYTYESHDAVTKRSLREWLYDRIDNHKEDLDSAEMEGMSKGFIEGRIAAYEELLRAIN